MSAIGRVLGVSKVRLGCAVSSTVAGDDTTTLIPVDAFVVDFDESGGEFEHQPTGDVYAYDSCDKDAETITLSAGLPTGKTLTAGDALHVLDLDGNIANDYYADLAVDDIDVDSVRARVPAVLRPILEEGTKKRRQGPLVRALPGSEEWEVTEIVGEEPQAITGILEPGDIKQTARLTGGGGFLVPGGWLACDGTAVSRTVYADLFSAITTTYGAGNGTTTFNIPDFRGRTGFGISSALPIGTNEGATEANRGPSHVHAIPGGNHTHGINPTNHSGDNNTAATGGANRVATLNGTVGGSHAHGGATDFEGGHDHTGETGPGTSASNRMGYITVTYLIKV